MTTTGKDTISGLMAGMSRELRCSICLFSFKDAVSTPCTHTFCRACIEKVLENEGDCSLCNKTFTRLQLNTAYNVQAIADEFMKMREKFEKHNDVNLSQLPIQYLSHQDTLEQGLPRPILGLENNEELKVSNVRASTNIPRQLKVYMESEKEDIDLPNLTFVNEINEDTTHIILDSVENKLVKTSYQYLLGILYGCYIVDRKWLRLTVELNKIQPEDRFEIEGEMEYGRTGAPKKSRDNRNEGKHQKLFKGVRAKFISDDKIAKRYEKYVRIGGGVIVDHGEIIVCSDDMDSIDVDEIHEQYPARKLISMEWIDECISKYELVRKDSYYCK